MIHWQDHPIALFPEDGSGDAMGCWSGCIVADEGVPSALYTGFVSPEETPVMLARAEDPGLSRWTKSPHNPVIGAPPNGVIQTDFRDPYVWREGELWKMVMGAGMENGESSVLLYQSENLVDWEYCGVLFERKVDSVRMWECPNFFQLGDHYVLMVSLFPNAKGVYYYVGDYDGNTFTPITEGYFDAGPSLYAPHVRCFPDGRTILFGWLMEQRTDVAIETAGWAGVQSIPRELTLDVEGHLVSKPIAESLSLRHQGQAFTDLVLEVGKAEVLPVHGRHLELDLVMEPSGGGVNLGVLASPEDEEVTWIRLDFEKHLLILDTTQSSLSGELRTGLQTIALPEKRGAEIALKVFVDGSVIEAWVDGRVALTGRAYPTQPDAHRLILLAQSEETCIKTLEVWELEAIWPVYNEESR
jgi:beta-fructofuranosidase